MKKLKILVAACGLAVLTIASAIAQTSPRLIPFQGRLTDQQGRAYTNGQFTLTFNLYSQAVGGTTLWTERHEKVGVINGMVNVFLGSISTLDQQDFATTKHLGIKIDADDNPVTTDPEMVPRQMIIPAFWAKNSEKLAGQDWTPIFGVNSPLGELPAAKIQAQGINTDRITTNAITTDKIAPGAVQTTDIGNGQITVEKLSPAFQLDTVIPPGTIQAFGGPNTPAGWLLCDGRAFSSNDHPRLFAAIGTAWGAGYTNISGVQVKISGADFNLPDLRGMFLRGVTGNRTDGYSDPDVLGRTNVFTGGATGLNVGSFQTNLFAAHNHALPLGEDSVGQGSGSLIGYVGNGVGGSQSANTGLRGGNETRPNNAYVHYIMKY